MTDQVVGKLWIDGARVLVVLRPLKADPPWVTWYAMAVSKIPVGVHYVPAGKSMGMLRVEHPDHRGYPRQWAEARGSAADAQMEYLYEGESEDAPDGSSCWRELVETEAMDEP